MPLILLVGAVFLFMALGASKAYAYVKGKPTFVDLSPIGGGFYLRYDAAKAFVAMRQQASSEGVTLRAESAFRTMEEQEKLYASFQQGTGNLAATPGFSNHQSGIAVDISVGSTFASKEYRWLADNGGKYGFVNVGASFTQQREPWHWEYRLA